MGFLLDDKAPDKINGQRDVVKNEKRQSVDNQPYGQAFVELSSLLYPPGHPYSWPTIGSMEDLTAASFEDVARFFRTYYVPNNASLVIAGDIDLASTRKLVEKWFGDVPARQAGAAADRADARCSTASRRRPSPIACSCRASTWRGTRRRCSSPATRPWTSSRTC